MIEQRFSELRELLSRAAGQPVTRSMIDAVTDFALDASDAGRADYALALLPSIARAAPREPRVWQILALALREEQLLPEAREAIRRAAACDPHDKRIACAEALFAMESGLPSAASFARLSHRYPDDAALLRNAAIARHAEGDAAGAYDTLTDALLREPTWMEGHSALATLCAGDGMSHLANEALDQAIACRPHHTELHIMRASRHFVERDWGAAEAALDHAESCMGDDRRLTALRAAIATEAGDLGDADRLFAACVQDTDESLTLYRVRHALRRRNWSAAEEQANRLLETPMAAAAWPYLSTIWRITDNPRATWLDGDPPFVRTADLPCTPQDLDRLASVLRSLHAARAPFPAQSVRGGTQTDKPLLFRDEAEISGIRDAIRRALTDYVVDLPPHVEGHPLLGTKRGALLFAGSWSVRLTDSGFHVAHTHTHGWISSALYVALPTGDGCGPAPMGWLELGAPPPELGLDLAPHTTIEPKPGRLVLFPSTMWHGTRPFPAGERLTIAFDVEVPRR